MFILLFSLPVINYAAYIYEENFIGPVGEPIPGWSSNYPVYGAIYDNIGGKVCIIK